MKKLLKIPRHSAQKVPYIVRGIFIGYSATKKTNTFLRWTTGVMDVFSLISERQKLYVSVDVNKEKTAMQRHNFSKPSAAVVEKDMSNRCIIRPP